MIISCIGDSLTEGDYGVYGKSGIKNVQEKNYPFFLKKSTGFEIRNFGVCGIAPSGMLQHYKDGNVNVMRSDYVIILLGSNGGLDPEKETQGNLDYKELVSLCRRDAPEAKICLVTPPHATENPEMSNYGYAPQVQRAVEETKKLADELNCELIDLASCPDFTSENEEIMQPNDGVHFSETGYKIMSDFILARLKELFPQDF